MTPENVLRLITTVVERPGADKLADWLVNESDFMKAPSSTKYHLAHEGGLLVHSLNVYNNFIAICNMYPDKLGGMSEESRFIVSFFHDLCKVDFYKKKGSGGDYYVVETLPMGHGEKSVYILQKYIWLYDYEAIAIRWHMGMTEAGTHFFYPTGASFNTALDTHPAVGALHIADLMSGWLTEKEFLGGK